MAKARLLTLSMASVLLFFMGCKEENSPITPEPGTGGTGATSGSGGKSAGTVCPAGAAGATMVLVTTDQGERYCIDQREVLQGEYHAFTQAKGSDTSGQPPECKDNEA